MLVIDRKIQRLDFEISRVFLENEFRRNLRALSVGLNTFPSGSSETKETQSEIDLAPGTWGA